MAVSYVDYVNALPGFVRLLIAIVVTVGITLTMVKVMYPRTLELNGYGPADAESGDGDDGDAKRVNGDQDDEDDHRDGPPGPKDLAGRVMTITATGFVFLLAFSLGNFWSANKDARSAAQDSVTAAVQVRTIANSFEPKFAKQVNDAVDAYAKTVAEREWPLLQRGDSTAAYKVQNDAGAAFSKSLAQIGAAGADQLPAWGSITSSAQTMISSGTALISETPSPMVPSILALVMSLAVANLALTAAFNPSRLRANMLLMGVFAAITAVMLYVVVEVSSPFLGSGALRVESVQPHE